MKKFNRKIVEILLLSLILLVAITSTNTFVEAKTFPWKWPTTKQKLNFHNVTGDSIWKTAAYATSSKWDISGSNLDLIVTDQNIDTNIYLSYQSNYYNSYYALVYVYDSTGKLIEETGSSYAHQAKIRMFSDTVNALDYPAKVQMLVHEAGHAIGLAHAPGENSVMNELKTFSYPGPTAYDINDVANKY